MNNKRKMKKKKEELLRFSHVKLDLLVDKNKN
jgi:hypothetical protein